MSISATELKTEVQLVDLQAQWASLQEEMLPEVQRVLAQANYILSEDVKKFEASFADFCSSKYCVGVASGTDAITLALEACGIGAGDEVLVPANTYVATVTAICHRGAKPVFVDAQESTFCMDLQDAKTKAGGKTRAVIPVHLFGRAMDLSGLQPWAQMKNWTVIEDACQAHGAAIAGRKAGTWGRAGCFSFYPGKNLGCYGDGGAVITDDQEIGQAISVLRNQGQSKKYHHVKKGYNSRLDSLQAAVLSVKLRHLEDWSRLRRRWAAYYDEHLAGVGDLRLPQWDKANSESHVFHLYVIRTARRDALWEYLRARGIGAQVHYPIPIHLQEGFNDLGFAKGSLPVAEKLAGEILSLPMYPELTEEKAGAVVDAIRKFFDEGAFGESLS